MSARTKLQKWFRDIFGNPKAGGNPEKLCKVNYGLPEIGHVLAFGHFTVDRNLDVFVLDSTRTKVHLYLWNRNEKKYKKSDIEISVGSDEQIINVVPSDFDHDGYLDLLVMSGPLKEDELDLKGIRNSLYLGDGSNLKPSGWAIPNSHAQLTPFDYKGHMQVDLVGSLARGTGNLEVLQSVASNSNQLSPGFKQVDFSPSVKCGTDGPQWNAFADVDGDGRPDLILTCSTDKSVDLTILLGSAGGYASPITISLPKSASQLTITDVDADGSPDIVYTTCDSDSKCFLNILYNSQRPFCSGSREDVAGCKPNTVHFEHDKSWGFKLEGPTHQTIELTEMIGKGNVLLRTDPLTKLPIPLSFGDYDLDGHPDLLLTVSSSAESAANAKAILLRNLPCTESLAGCQAKESRRTFLPKFENVEALAAELGIVQAAFGDVRGNGALSIIGNGYKDGKPFLSLFDSDAFNDAFFVRSESLNGVCPAPCSRKATGSKASQPYGVNYSGASFRLSFTDIDGSVRVRSASQLAQTGNRALQQPFAIFGLGRTNSFVDTFSAGVSASLPGVPHHQSTFHIIPNSDLIVIPPHADSPTDWVFQIHIHPAAHFIWVTVALATALAVLMSLTAFFKVKERREDEAEKRKRAHAINFDAM